MWVKRLLSFRSVATISIYWPLIKGFVHLCGITISVITSLHFDCLKIQSEHSLNVCYRMEWTVISLSAMFNGKTITADDWQKFNRSRFIKMTNEIEFPISWRITHQSNSLLIYVIASNDAHFQLINDCVLHNKSVNGFCSECCINVEINFTTTERTQNGWAGQLIRF